MYKPNNKKMLTVLIAVAMIFSALAILSFAAQPAYAQTASGTVTYTPSTITPDQLALDTGYLPVIYANGGSFSGTTTLYFYWSSTNSATGLLAAQGTATETGTVTSPASDTYTVVANTLTPETATLTFTAPSGFVNVISVTLTAGTATTVSDVTVTSWSESGTTVTVDVSLDVISTTTTAAISSSASVEATTESTAAVSPNFSYTIGSATTLTNALLTPTTHGVSTTVTPGETLYLIASPSSTLTTSGGSLATSSSFTVSKYNPKISIDPTTVQAGKETAVSGSGFNPSATSAAVYFAANGIAAASIGTISLVSGQVAANQYISMPTNVPYGSYDLYAVDSASSEYAGVSVTVSQAISVSPLSITGSASSTFTITGYGFPAASTIAAGSSSVTLSGGSPYATATGTVSSSVVVGSNGQFVLPIAGLSSSLKSNSGGYTITISLTTLPAGYTGLVSPSFSDAIYVSSPESTNLGFSFSAPQGNYAGYPVVSAVWNFPASTSVVITLGSYTVGTVTTDANGFAELPTTATLPAIPYGVYSPIASVPSIGIHAYAGSTFTLYSYVYAEDTAGSVLNGEYVPYNGEVTVVANALTPETLYSFSDANVGGNLVFNGAVTSVSVGTEVAADNAFYPASNGTLIFTYETAYASSYSGGSTGTTDTITYSGMINGTAQTAQTVGTYAQIGAPSFSTTPSYSVEETGSTLSITFTGLIPAGATVYPTQSTYYSLYLGTQLEPVLLSGVGTLDEFYSTSSTNGAGSATVSFTVPAGVTGLQNLSIVYGGASVGSAINTVPIVISTPGGTAAIGATYSNTHQTLEVYGYNFFGSEGITVYVATYSGVVKLEGLSSFSGTYSAGTSGGFSGSGTLSEPAGTYEVFVVPPTGFSSVPSVSYAVSPVYDHAKVIVHLYPYQETANSELFSSGIAVAEGLQPSTWYNLNLGGQIIDTELTGSNGVFTTSSAVYVPLISAGSYNLTITSVAAPTTAILSLGITMISNSNLVLSTGSQYAFPDQLVQFSVAGFTEPTGYSGYSTVQYFAQIYFNNTLFTTVPATFGTVSGTTVFNGSFVAPNNAPGSYYEMTIKGYALYNTGSVLSSVITGGGTFQLGLSPSAGVSDFFGLVSGNGALLTGISSSEIATIEADITSTVSTSLKVPISQLDAAITSINGAVANLKTTVGNISVDLSTINATVASIESGQVLVMTKLGSIETSLASLNASLTAFNGNVVMINTTLGQVQTSLSSIGTQVTANANGIATIKTDLGTVQGQIVSTNGNITTIKTSLGTLTANVSTVQKQTSGFPTLEIFLIVIIVLVLITLVVAFLAVSAANKAARRATEEKKQ